MLLPLETFPLDMGSSSADYAMRMPAARAVTLVSGHSQQLCERVALRRIRDRLGEANRSRRSNDRNLYCCGTDCLAWWKKRGENDRAWKVPASELLANNCNLDRKNPLAREDITHLPPEQLAENILQKEQQIAEVIENIKKTLAAIY
jgi:hypothetical protein